ncbi:spermatogenesis-associated protein 20-like isoform X2 [Gigantopelta aegis]|uniref:spermatogenesis-associated protein 20-like isoform X2 n=1 Tax=Gigantopelta aegis TaxID=1735272 RepID=UPI001B88D92A|nr:spermatogenesis-associated protein 20-like isoform X2 [Gigantopelta aegis]
MYRFCRQTIFSGINVLCRPKPSSFSCKKSTRYSHNNNKNNTERRPFFICGQKLSANVGSCQVRTMASVGSSSGAGHQNKLSQEKSPYLLQHASNPVDWYPWGEEAFEKAKKERKLIFLSVGYSTCHWCHVMERESFENEEIGKILNENFISIKVDREERPDVDKVYMTFVQATTGSGGWPMSVWLTPDLKPVVGGTYFPPDDRYYGRPGFKSILLNIAEKWNLRQDKIEEQGTAILDALMQTTQVEESGGSDRAGQDCVDKCYQMLEKSYDPEMGGFSNAPKFPQPVNLKFLLHFYGSKPDSCERKRALDMAVHTLKMMAKGGMHDHVAQGFHRYSTDKFWHVPHFEKMLYDQAQLAVAYLDAYQITKDKFLAETARDIFKYVSRDLSHPAGGFYSAEDADSLPTADSKEKKEGAFCVWTWGEVQTNLTGLVEGKPDLKEADVFCHHYDVKQDPHDELKGQNVLIVRGSLEDTAAHFGLDVTITETVLEKCRQKLYLVRQSRPKPHLDNKMVAAWNGLMVSGFARGGQVLQDSSLTARAIKAAEFLQSHMFLSDSQVLLRSCYTSQDKTVTQISSPIEGFVDDYTFVIRGLLDLYEACYNDRWLQWAEQLQETQDKLFWDDEAGGYFSSGLRDPTIVLRMKDDQDGAEPSSNSVSAMNLLRLSHFLNRTEWQDKGSKLFQVFYQRLAKIPIAVPELVCALVFALSTPKQIIIYGDKESEDTKEMFKTVHESYLPNKVVIHADGSSESFLRTRLPILETLSKVDGKTTAYVCENYSCSLPVNSTQELKKLLASHGKQAASL